MEVLKVGMISFAHAGHPDSYLSRLVNHPQVEIVGIVEKNKSRVQEYVDKYNIPYYQDHTELFKNDCDAVIICSEYAYHAEIVKAAAKAKVDILCEKPLGLSIDEMHEMIEICEIENVKFMTAFPSRYSKAFIEAKEMIEAGEIGDILGMKGTNRGINPGNWFLNPQLSGGGALMDHTVHIMDIMFWFTGSQVEEVYAVASTKFHDIAVEDVGIVNVKFKNGALGTIDTSWSLHEKFPQIFDLTLEIIGTKGHLYIDALAEKNDVYRKGEKQVNREFWGDNIDVGLIDAFIDAIINDKPVPITGQDGFNATTVALATYESIKLNSPIDFQTFLNKEVNANE